MITESRELQTPPRRCFAPTSGTAVNGNERSFKLGFEGGPAEQTLTATRAE